MKIDVTKTLIAFDGTAVTGENDQPITLRKALTIALTASLPNDTDGEDKFKRVLLATRIHTEEQPDLTPEDLVKAKQFVGKIYGPAVVGAVYTLLNG